MAKEVKLYQYVAFYTPSEKEQKESGVQPKVLIELKSVLVSTEQEALILASRDIPAEYMNKLSQVSIVVRPF